MLLCNKIDLDLEDEKEVYLNAQETVKYLQDIINSLEKRVIKGEKIPGFVLVEGRKTRVLTENGLQHLINILGEDVMMKKTVSPIGISELDNILSKEEVASLIHMGYIAFKVGAPKVKILED